MKAIWVCNFGLKSDLWVALPWQPLILHNDLLRYFLYVGGLALALGHSTRCFRVQVSFVAMAT